jgi:ATP-dependent Zn protease
MSRSQRRDLTTAYHEAGHVVVAHSQQTIVKRVTIELGDGYHGVTESVGFSRRMRPDVEVTIRTRDRIERQARILLAGEIAQRRKAPRSVRNVHHQTDCERAVDFLDYPCASDRELSLYIKLLRVQTEQLIELYWPEIETVARALIERRTLNAREVREVIRAAWEAGETSESTMAEPPICL